MVELVDTLDLKSNGHCGCGGSSPPPGTKQKQNNMNFIYTLVFFALMFIGVFLGKTFVDPTATDTYLFFVVTQWIIGIVSGIFAIVGFFVNMSGRQSYLELKNSYARQESNVRLAEEQYNNLQEKYQKYLAEQYPALEKEIFSNIASNQPKELVALLQAYPELKSSVVLNNMMDKITTLVSNIYEAKRNLAYEEEQIANMRINRWYFKAVFNI